ncbi:hypothetical protein PILCRDRAFT_5003 [Piloderma croceum F 1598]|uniref:Uncharacterized protein n=1 Tax=Piloderma croceum (strain F 1598) TaxID=765440 RepID=A0A0C3FPC3_PILCF|nr:hypothetical protein PILCRDRAFT_5003 [Piloderma croceum F 1598]
MSLATALLLFALLGNGLGVLVNRTIDDQFGDPIARITPTYAPIALWTQGAICQLCGAKPDIHQVFNHTWHDSTYTVQDGQTRNITIPFNGSAIYIFFFTVPKTVYISETHLNITLDGHPAVYSNSKLVSGQHIIMLSTGGNADAVLEFDYAIYSTDDGKQSRLGAIVGGIVGAIVAIFIFILLWFWRRRRRRGRARDEDNPPVVDVNEVSMLKTPLEPISDPDGSQDKKNILRGQLEELSNIQRNSQPGLAG